MTNDNLEKIEKRLAELEEKEARIEKEELEILSVDQHILKEVEKTRKESRLTRTVYRLRFIISILLTVGVALIWQGIGKLSDTLPLISSAIGALVVGLLILITISWLTKNSQV
jgi:hypothetical protein